MEYNPLLPSLSPEPIGDTICEDYSSKRPAIVAGYNIPMNIATPKMAEANEYGRYILVTRGFSAPLPAATTSPDFANVTVAAGAIVIVFVTVIGVPV